MEPTNSPAPTPPPTPDHAAFREGRPPASSRPAPARSSMLRYALSLGLLIAVIGVIAWVVQYLPSRTKTPKKVESAQASIVRLLDFPRYQAQWDVPQADPKQDDLSAKEINLPKEVEYGTEGFYDFPFKNISGKEVEMIYYATTCDCTSVRGCALPMAEVNKAIEDQTKKPGEPVHYSPEPDWVNLSMDRAFQSHPESAKVIKVPADGGGVVRVRWTVKKTPGQFLKLTPTVVFRKVGDDDRHAQVLSVPVLVGTAIRFEPPRVNVGLLTPGCKPVTAEFDAWSSTREKFDLNLTPHPENPFFKIENRPLSSKECEDLAANMKTEKAPAPRVRSGQHVTITVYETKDGKQLDQGPFYQKLAITLDGVEERELPGPEIVGRVQGDIRIGGSEDQGKIMFKAFSPSEGAAKTVELLADANVVLEPSTHEPAWLEVSVKKYKEQLDAKKHRWQLRVTVPANTPGVRSFEESDHVTLRIKGTTGADRFVRIAIQGALSGR